MRIRPVLQPWKTGAAVAAALMVLGTAADAAAQGQRTSAPLAVTATVVRTCIVEQVRPALPETPSPSTPGQVPMPAPGPTYRLRCGQQVVSYPAPPGTVAPTAKSPASVAGAPDGRLVIQF